MRRRLKLGLIGQPVAHSKSPQIHKHFADQFGFQLDYQLIDAAEVDVAHKVEEFFRHGGDGLNVTLPHKGAVIPLCTAVAKEARLAGAVNTLNPGDDGLHGENTDGRGLVRDLQRLNIRLKQRRIVVIGAGGAARGIIAPLLACEPEQLIWSNRSIGKLQGREIPFQAAERLQISANAELQNVQADVVIHASSAGHQGICPELPTGLCKAGCAAYDLSYGRAAQPFLAWSKQQGCQQAHEGIGMLIEQAALAWGHWLGLLPDTETLIKAGL